MKRHYNIPIFVPHMGCKQNCTFCNQQKISGEKKQVTGEDVKNTIEEYLKSFKEDGEVEVAFFGGSFTGIPEDKQLELLDVAYSYVKCGKVSSIRCSTRPDYINKNVLKRLKKYGVKTIELGVQSSNDYILNKCKRGHTFEDVKKASKLIRRHGFILGHQMMVGLPDSTRIDELNTAKACSKLKPKIVRIYPVLVIKGTQLEKDYNNGKYEPLSLPQAVDTCKELCEFFRKKHINVIRIGLQNTESISSPDSAMSEVVAGPYHEAFGQLVEGAIWYDRILEKIKGFNSKVKEAEIRINPEDVNNVVGHKRENVLKLKELYEVKAIVRQDEKIKQDKFEIKVLSTYTN